MSLEEQTGPFVLGFNGPPRSGKDTIAQAVMNQLDKEGCNVPVHKYALAGTMRAGAAAILGIDCTDRWYHDNKDIPLDVLNGGTFRRFMIDMSEHFVKALYGQDFWAKLLHARNRTWWNGIPSILIITDIGFSAEVEFLCEHSRHYLGVRVDRPNTDFSKDSRSYVASQVYGGKDLAITNDGTPEEAADQILKVMYKNGWPVL